MQHEKPASVKSKQRLFHRKRLETPPHQKSKRVPHYWQVVNDCNYSFIHKATIMRWIVWDCFFSQAGCLMDLLIFWMFSGSYNLMINSNQDDIVIKTADSESPSNEAQSSTTLLSPAMSGPCCWVEEERRCYPGNGFMPGQPIHWDIAYYWWYHWDSVPLRAILRYVGRDIWRSSRLLVRCWLERENIGRHWKGDFFQEVRL